MANTLFVGWFIRGVCEKMSYTVPTRKCPNGHEFRGGNFCGECGAEIIETTRNIPYFKHATATYANSGAEWRKYTNDWTKSVSKEDTDWIMREFYELNYHPNSDSIDILIPSKCKQEAAYDGTIISFGGDGSPEKPSDDILIRLQRIVGYVDIRWEFGALIRD